MGIPAEILSVDGLGLTLQVNGTELELSFHERAYINSYGAKFNNKFFYIEDSDDVRRLVERLAEGDEKLLLLADLASLTSYPTKKNLLKSILREGNSLSGVMRSVIRSLSQRRRLYISHTYDAHALEETKRLLKKCLELFPEEEVQSCMAALEELQIKTIARQLRN